MPVINEKIKKQPIIVEEEPDIKEEAALPIEATITRPLFFRDKNRGSFNASLTADSGKTALMELLMISCMSFLRFDIIKKFILKKFMLANQF